MSNKNIVSKKKRKLKVQKNQQKRERRIYELKKLEAKASDLEKEILNSKKDNLKKRHIRNLKIFKTTSRFLVPFAVIAGILTGITKLFGFGYPFINDNIVMKKRYDFEYETFGEIQMDEYYQTYLDYLDCFLKDTNEIENSLVLYTPWERENDKYISYKREYNVSREDTLNVINAILDEDYDYLMNNLSYDEEKQIVYYIDNVNPYIIKASLHMQDKKDVLKYPESKDKNLAVSIIFSITVLISGSLLRLGDFKKYKRNLEHINNLYNDKLVKIEPLQNKLDDTNQKILSLKRKIDNNG